MKLKQVRGGAWYHVDWLARCAYRIRLTPDYRSYLVGFRCCFERQKKG